MFDIHFDRMDNVNCELAIKETGFWMVLSINQVFTSRSIRHSSSASRLVGTHCSLVFYRAQRRGLSIFGNQSPSLPHQSLCYLPRSIDRSISEEVVHIGDLNYVLKNRYSSISADSSQSFSLSLSQRTEFRSALSTIPPKPLAVE